MKRDFRRPRSTTPGETPCWKDVFESAIVGGFPIVHRLEQMLDQLEQKA